MNATVTLNPVRNAGAIDPRIFSGFLEHLGRAVYGGIYDPGNTLSDQSGYRKDVLQALGRLRMPLVRYPGGNFVSNYDWKDGIGAREARPRRADFAWQTLEPNTFGTDEFMDWCRALGTRPMLAVNLGTGTPKSAAELVEYCNFPAGTSWSDLRAANGHTAPHSVPVWCLGNELDGPWQAGHMPAGEYALHARQAGALMKGIDPAIELVAAGSSGRAMSTYLEWDREVLETCWDNVDYISAHRYSRNDRDDTPWFLAEGMEIERILEDYRGLLAYVRGLKRSSKKVYIAFDEWNVWYKDRARRSGGWRQSPHLVEEVYNLEDALVCAQYMNAFIRNADIVKIACVAQIVNVIAPILTRNNGLLLQTTYWPLAQYAESARGVSLTPLVECPTYDAGERGKAPVLDVSASWDRQPGSLALFVVNRDMQNAVDVTVRLQGLRPAGVEGFSVLAGGDPKLVNSWESPDAVRPRSCPVSTPGDSLVSISTPPLSYNVLQLRTESLHA